MITVFPKLGNRINPNSLGHLHIQDGHSFMTDTLPRLSSDRRLFALEGASPIDQMHVERWTGQEQLSTLFTWNVIALCAEHNLLLDSMLGLQVRLLTTLADGTQSVRSGLVSEVVNQHTDGALTRYHLTLVPWLWTLTQSTNSRTFQDLNVLEILEQVFSDYSQYAKWTFRACARGLIKSARSRSYCVQYRETDFDFVQRLMAEEGLGYCFVEDDEAPSGHCLVVFGDSAYLEEDPTSISGLRCHRSGATEAQDSIQFMGPSIRLSTGSITLLSFDYKTQQAISGSYGSDSPGACLESYDPVGSYAFRTSAEAEHYARLHIQAQTSECHNLVGHGTVRSARCGTRFNLPNTPWGKDSDSDTERSFLYTSLLSYGINNLTDTSCLRNADALKLDQFDAQVIARAEQTGFAQQFEAVDREQRWRPTLEDGTGQRLNPYPTSRGAQTAIVVGPDGKTTPGNGVPLYCDALGRVRIRFHWQADDDLGACWVRVSQVLTGQGHGAQFLPRIGHEVLVQFMDGNMDHPVIIKSLYNGRGDGGVAPTPGGAAGHTDLSVYEHANDHRPSAELNRTGGNSPAWHGGGAAEKHHRNAAALSGIKTQGFDGNGYNQLVFDDSDQQGRIQMATTQACSQLNMGHLIHQVGNFRGSFRGLGFELRSDAYGAIRAKCGLLISTYGIDADTPAGDAIGALALHEQHLEIAKRFDAAAEAHQSVPLASVRGVDLPNQSAMIADMAPLDALFTSMITTVRGDSLDNALSDSPLRQSSAADGRVPHTGDALLILSARASLLQVAGQSLQHHAGETLSLGSGLDSNFATAEHMRLHSGQAIGYLGGATEAQDVGLSMIAGEGPLEVQAQTDDITVRAQDEIKLMSLNGETELAAGKAIVLKVEGGASLTIKDGNITFSCPGTMTVHAAEHVFEDAVKAKPPGFDFPEALLAPVPLAAASPDHRLQSTFALDQLTTLANTTTAAEFVMMLVPIFGFDIPARTYIKLHTALREGSIAHPEMQVTRAVATLADYDNDRRIIRVHPGAIDSAVEHVEASRHLLAVLLHEFGHHIDNVLRTDLADKHPDGTSTLAPDGPLDEGARYAYHVAFFDLANTGEAVYAQYESPDYSGPLKVDYQDAYEAIKASQGDDAATVEVKNGSRESFGAGRGEHHKTKPQGSFGHESVEDALKKAGFTTAQCKAIYFGNWLRDYSQLLDPKIVLAPGEPKQFPYKFSRETLTKLVNLLAIREFHTLVRKQPESEEGLDFVTPEMLLVYRPVEHIDNPKNLLPDPPDPQAVDPMFSPWVLPGDPKLEILPVQSIKRYILDSSIYMQNKLDSALRAGATPEGMRFFGEGLHVLEDYFAHSNFVELSLRKLGYDNVLPWTAAADCRHRWPVVTGMFGSFDVIASLAEPLAIMLFPIDDWEFKATKPGGYSDTEKMMQILLDDHENPELLAVLNGYLELRDKWASIPGHEHVERVGWMAASPMRLLINAHNLMFQTLLQLMGNSVHDGQTIWDNNPNTSTSTDPSHSQLAKDHDTHPFHTLATELASYAVEHVGRTMRDCWNGQLDVNPAQQADRFICHPNDSSWQDEIVSRWARKNPALIRQGESATTLEHLHKEYVESMMERIRNMSGHGKTGWEYIHENYSSLFGKESQVQP